MNVRNLLIPLLLLALPAAAAEPAKALDPAALDPAVKPCEDFYQYANGSWIKANPVPADKARWGAFEELGELVCPRSSRRDKLHAESPTSVTLRHSSTREEPQRPSG